jgi:type I restriction enzyme R subunit
MLQNIFSKISELNRKNANLKKKYGNDAKFARVHKRVVERGSFTKQENDIADILLDIKGQADDRILVNRRLLDNESYFQGLMMNMVFDGFQKTKVDLDPESATYINNCVVKEYINEYQGNNRW